MCSFLEPDLDHLTGEVLLWGQFQCLDVGEGPVNVVPCQDGVRLGCQWWRSLVLAAFLLRVSLCHLGGAAISLGQWLWCIQW